MCGKIRAAVDARHSPETLIIARTDAVAVEGVEPAIERAELYRAAGADVLFVEAPRTRDDLARIASRLGAGVPLLANMVEGGKTPPLSAAELEAIGFALVIFPGGIVRALARTAGEYYASLAKQGTTEPFRSRMLDLERAQHSHRHAGNGGARQALRNTDSAGRREHGRPPVIWLGRGAASRGSARPSSRRPRITSAGNYRDG